MDPILIGAIGALWIAALAGGSLITLGTIGMVNGTAVLNFQRVNWTADEARLLGLLRIVAGLDLGLYGLFEALFVSRVIPMPGIGQPFGIIVTAPFWLIFMAALVAQLVLEARHRSPPRSGVR